MHLSKSIGYKFKYKDFNGSEAICEIEAIRLQDGRVVVIATELDENCALPVNSSVESLATAACKSLNVHPGQLVLITHYVSGTHGECHPELFDLVAFGQIRPQSDPAFVSPAWDRMNTCDWEALGIPPRS